MAKLSKKIMAIMQCMRYYSKDKKFKKIGITSIVNVWVNIKISSERLLIYGFYIRCKTE